MEKSRNKKIMKRITKLVEAIEKSPFRGIGKPEPLKHELSGFWYRRIDKEQRIIYEVLESRIVIHSLKGHY